MTGVLVLEPRGSLDEGMEALAARTTTNKRVIQSLTPLISDFPDRYLLVIKGVIDLFFVSVDPSVGIRRHLGRIELGGLSFGMDSKDEAFRLEIVGEDAEIAYGPISDLSNALKQEESEGLHKSLDQWIELIGREAAESPCPRDCIRIQVGSETESKAGGCVGAASDTIWIKDNAANIWFINQRPVGKNVATPVTRTSWVSTHEPVSIKGLGIKDAGVDLRRDLPAYHGLIHSILSERIIENLAFEAKVICEKQGRDLDTLARATNRLAEIARVDASALESTADDQPILAALQLVGKSAGITIQPPKKGVSTLETGVDLIKATVEASRCEMRTVDLSGSWYKVDMGPLLVFTQDDMEPLALIPNRPGNYDLINPKGGYRTHVDKNTAGEIFDVGVMLYPTLPDRPSSITDVLGIGIHQTKDDFLSIGAMVLLVGIASIAMPIVSGEITGIVVQEGQVNQLVILIGALVVASLSSVGFTFVQSIAALRIEGKIDVRGQASLWNRLLRLPPSFFREYTVGDLSMRVMGIDAMRQLLTTSALNALLSIATGIFSLGLMFYYDWALAAISMLLMTIYCVIYAIIVRVALKRQRKLLDNKGRLLSVTLHLLQSVAKLRVTGSEAKAYERWSEMYAKTQRLSYSQQELANCIPVINALFSYLGFVMLVVVIGVQADQLFSVFHTSYDWLDIDQSTVNKVIVPSTFIAFYVAFGQFYSAMTRIAQTGMGLAALIPLRDRLAPLLKATPENSEGGEDPGELRGDIEINSVEFRYSPDGPLVLRGMNMKIHEGEFAAMVGPSGAGKSSIIRLLLGFEEPEAGSIYIDGKDIAQINKRAMRKQIGVVLQNGRLLSGSIFDNIVAGSNLTKDHAWRAARMAGFDKDIESMPMGMHSFVSEGGSTLSGGQRQRLMIARAIARKPRLLIFDEATSALDNETQKIVSDALAKLNTTRLVIAHRLSTIIHADRIFVVDQGVITETGTYDELMELDGTFAQLANRQIA